MLAFFFVITLRKFAKLVAQTCSHRVLQSDQQHPEAMLESEDLEFPHLSQPSILLDDLFRCSGFSQILSTILSSGTSIAIT